MDGLIAYALAKKYADKVGQSILDAGFKVQVEQDRSVLNRTGEQMTLYLLPKESSLSSDTYDEYVYTTKWEQVGSTDIELDYNNLSNKPRITALNRKGGWETTFDIQNVIELMGFYLYENTSNKKRLKISDNILEFSMLQNTLQKEIFKDYGLPSVSYPYDFFTNPNSAPQSNGIWEINNQNLNGLPVPESGYLFNYVCNDKRIQFYLTDEYSSAENKFRLYFRLQSMSTFLEWIELTGGSEIASAAVNQNGTITFYDKDSNLLFTTSGEKLMTSGNQQISMGYDNGGFYFLFDDGQEVVNDDTN